MSAERDDNRRRLFRVVRLLRIFAGPTDERTVKVRISKDVPIDRLGDCTQRKDHYLIRINKDVFSNSPDAVYLVLAHEWAHALAWELGSTDHGDPWGLAVARCWRIISGEISAGALCNVGLE